eukprot:TRINITY_DN8747_c0_g1_i2.p1 TRINITY_DN8747_c0_g1~~TRINITY_DN8747_c0_g1_i2.p1  ORF type:complete len:137 (+),score=4.14 TRINITY_DN8747_c0_g1_i2:91-501(+)
MATAMKGGAMVATSLDEGIIKDKNWELKWFHAARGGETSSTVCRASARRRPGTRSLQRCRQRQRPAPDQAPPDRTQMRLGLHQLVPAGHRRALARSRQSVSRVRAVRWARPEPCLQRRLAPTGGACRHEGQAAVGL